MGRLARLTLVLAALTAATGCASAAGVVAEKAADSMDSVEYEIAWIVHSMDGMTAGVTPEEAVNASAARAAEFWTAGCFMFSIEGATVTYTLTDCGGPFEIVRLSGTVTITYNDTGSGIGFDIVASDLTIRENTVSFSISADVATDGRNVSVTTSGSVLGRRGFMLTRNGTYNLQWNGSSECAGIDSGSWETTVEGEAFATSISNWRRCGINCPAAGATVSFSGSGTTVTVSYDGTRQASWTSSGGESGSLRLFCNES